MSGRFRTVIGVIMIVVGFVILVFGAYLAYVANRATDTSNDQNAKLTKPEKQGGLAVAIIQVFVGVAAIIYGIILVIPSKNLENIKNERFRRSLQSARSFRAQPRATQTEMTMEN